MLLARRRPRGSEPAPPELAHALLGPGAASYETDRARFLGRGRSLARPAAQAPGAPLTGTLGNVLDPITSWRRDVTLAPGESAAWLGVLALGATGADAAARARAAAARADATAGAPLAASATAERAPRFRPSDLAHDAAAAPDEPLLLRQRLRRLLGRRPRVRDPHPAGRGRPAPPAAAVDQRHRQPGLRLSRLRERRREHVEPQQPRAPPDALVQRPDRDPHGEALYVRDEEAGVFWSPSRGRRPRAAPYEVRHGFGYSSWTPREPRARAGGRRRSSPRDAPVKLVRLRLDEPEPRARARCRCSPTRSSCSARCRRTRARIVVDARATRRSRCSRRTALAGEFADGVAFAAVGVRRTRGDGFAERRPHARSSARRVARRPAALAHGRRARRPQPARRLDPCFALQLALRLAPGETRRRARSCSARRRAATEAAGARRALSRGRARSTRRARPCAPFWERTLGAMRVETPSPALDLLRERLARVPEPRAAASGAARPSTSPAAPSASATSSRTRRRCVYLRPELTRAQILLHAAHQFVEGDVLHWWHPPHDRGIAHALLRRPALAAVRSRPHYVAATGDAARARRARRLPDRARARAGRGRGVPARRSTPASAPSVYEHCCRALDRSLTAGAHGLPLMGTGDWNDGMNRVGREGRGESVWMGFFLFDLLRRLRAALPSARRRGARRALPRVSRARSRRRSNARPGTAPGTGAPITTTARRSAPRRSDECRIDALRAGVGGDLRRGAGASARARRWTPLERELVMPEGDG